MVEGHWRSRSRRLLGWWRTAQTTFAGPSPGRLRRSRSGSARTRGRRAAVRGGRARGTTRSRRRRAEAHPRVDPQPADVVRGVDAQVLEEEPAEGVEDDVERERLPPLEAQPLLDEQENAAERAGSRATRRGTSGGTSCTARSRRAVGGRDLEPPREGGGPAEQLLVEPVPPPADGLGENMPGATQSITASVGMCVGAS